jgi:hypothetical protein
MSTPLTVATVSAAAVENPLAASDATATSVPNRLERDLNIMMSPLITLNCQVGPGSVRNVRAGRQKKALPGAAAGNIIDYLKQSVVEIIARLAKTR